MDDLIKRLLEEKWGMGGPQGQRTVYINRDGKEAADALTAQAETIAQLEAKLAKARERFSLIHDAVCCQSSGYARDCGIIAQAALAEIGQ